MTVTTESPGSLNVDAVVVGYYAADDGPLPASGAESVDTAYPGGLARTLSLLGATGAAEEVHSVPSQGALSAPVVIAVGLGAPPGSGSGPDPDALSRAAGAALRSRGTEQSRIALALPAGTAELVEAGALGALLGDYSFTRYRTGDDTRSPATELLVASAAEGAGQAAEHAEAIAAAVVLSRDLVNTAPADLVPEDLAGAATEVARETGLDVQVLEEQELAEGGYGGLIGVGQGSDNPPRLVRLEHTHPEARSTIAFVGKGITFDSGGLSLKPAGSMDWMKSDMAGAAAVLGAMGAIGRLHPAVNVVAYLAIAENMPGGSAQRPSDVLTIYGGKTVEVLNTDAEGRLVMADALVRAHEDSPDLIVDAATLTGAQLTALGSRVFGVMSNDDGARDEAVAAATAAGEQAWPMPLPAELRQGLDSSVADIANVAGDRMAGMLSAGVFLKEFITEGTPWVHVDFAGPSFNQGRPFGYTPKGGTGAVTRTLVRIAENHAAREN
ncbi:leucyl aminopeptidase [Streptomonospora sediminis]